MDDDNRTLWECAACSNRMQHASRKGHAAGVHKVPPTEIGWICLDDIPVWLCRVCHYPLPSERAKVLHEKTGHRMGYSGRGRDYVGEIVEGAFWVDWSDASMPAIRVYDEKGEGTPLTILEAREAILYVAREALTHWLKVARMASTVTPEDIERDYTY